MLQIEMANFVCLIPLNVSLCFTKQTNKQTNKEKAWCIPHDIRNLSDRSAVLPWYLQHFAVLFYVIQMFVLLSDVFRRHKKKTMTCCLNMHNEMKKKVSISYLSVSAYCYSESAKMMQIMQRVYR